LIFHIEMGDVVWRSYFQSSGNRKTEDVDWWFENVRRQGQKKEIQVCAKISNSYDGGWANHPNWELSWITWDAAQPGRVEGFLRALLTAIIHDSSDHGARIQLWCESGFSQPTLSTFPLAGNQRLLVELWLTIFTQLSWIRSEKLRSQKRLLWLTTVTSRIGCYSQLFHKHFGNKITEARWAKRSEENLQHGLRLARIVCRSRKRSFIS
jgi:hypothetical protein